jgi:gamma-glutamylcyclotransferase (GGCT)/AIG2-like uncharacterized protein YtfP
VTEGLALFVYGTLAPGGRAFRLVAGHVERAAEDRVTGRLYDTGHGYPGARFDPAPEPSTVHGWVLGLRAGPDVDALLERLDEFEGHEYARRTVGTHGGVEAVAWEWIAPVDGFVVVPGGRWPPP